MLEHPGLQCCGEFWIGNPSQPSPTCCHSLQVIFVWKRWIKPLPHSPVSAAGQLGICSVWINSTLSHNQTLLFYWFEQHRCLWYSFIRSLEDPSVLYVGYCGDCHVVNNPPWMADRFQCLPWCLFLLPWYSCLNHDQQFDKDEPSRWQYLFEAGGCESAAWESQMVFIEVIHNEVTLNGLECSTDA